jgi:hypothetical protein
MADCFLVSLPELLSQLKIVCFPQPFPAEIPACMICIEEGRSGLVQDPSQFQVRTVLQAVFLGRHEIPKATDGRIPFQGSYSVYLGAPAVRHMSPTALIHRPLEPRISQFDANSQYKEETRSMLRHSIRCHDSCMSINP